jgi:tellurite resistance protein TerC
VTADYHGQRFFVRQANRLWATPLLIVLVMIETTDIAFATDSIPAIFAITRDTFIIFTSNIFAVLGLRSLYFIVAGFMTQFHLLKYGLSVVLAFIGAKMLIQPWVDIHITVSLIVIFSVVLLSILLSVVRKRSTRT